MNKEFIPYELSLEFKQLGFNEPCFGYWKMSDWLIEEKTRTDGYTHADQLCSAPTFSQAFRWFRENHNLQCWNEPSGSDSYSCRYDGNDETGYRWVGYLRNINNEILYYSTYEQAELACLKKLIEIVKQKL
jgi:hypothetical protein